MSNKIVETIKNSSGEIMQYVLENGATVDKAQGVEMAKNGEIDGVIIAHSKKGEEYPVSYTHLTLPTSDLV